MPKTIQIASEFRPLFRDDWREAAVYGGRFSLKSHTIARYLLIQARMKKCRIACFREFQNSIAESSHQLLADLIKEYELNEFQVTNNAIVNTLNGSDFIFKGLHHNEQSVKSIEGIDIAWVEEAQTVSQTSLEVLTPTVRSEGSKIIYSYNRLLENDPVHTRIVIEGRPNSLILNVNYDVALKYGWMPDVIRLEMEDDKEKRPTLYKTKWLGLPASLESRIYKDWLIIDVLPHEARLKRRGLDFGYTNDPTAIIDVYEYNGGFILDEVCYQKGMTNEMIATTLKALERVTVLADSAEPKSIDELKLHGLVILPAQKGPGSVNQGIQYLQAQRISVTKRSVNLISEYYNYLWTTDKNGKIINEPIGGFDHCFAGGSLVRTTKGLQRIQDLVGSTGFLFTTKGLIKRYSHVRVTRENQEMVDISFTDGTKVSVTPDHLLLQPDGSWKEAGLIVPSDMIQSDTYDSCSVRQRAKVLWGGLQKVCWRKILQGPRQWKNDVLTSLRLGNLWRGCTKDASCPSQEPRSELQHVLEFRTCGEREASKRTHDSGETTSSCKPCGRDKTPNKSVAWIKRGKSVACVTWEESICAKKTFRERMRSLPYEVYNIAVQRISKILPPELQNASKTKTVERISRGFSPLTYNLEVEDTHCLLVDGVIAHNCLDAARYALSPDIKVEYKKREKPPNNPYK